MLVDATRVHSTTEDADVCVVGGGPAGLTLARQLGASGLRVVVLESGGFDLEPAAEALAKGEARSRHHAPEALSLGRRRQFGGTANLWIHRSIPWDRRLRARVLPARAIDFEARDGIPHSGWPLNREDLDPYYERAQAVCELGKFDYEPPAWTQPGFEPFNFPTPTAITSTICQYAPRDVFTHRARDDLARMNEATVYLHTTALALDATPDGSGVRSLRAHRAGANELTIRAQAFVLAGGAIENARLLLVSPGPGGRGLGDRHGNVGRFLCDHPEFRLGAIVPESPDLFDRAAFYDLRWAGEAMVSGMLALSEEEMRADSLLSMGFILVPQPVGYGSNAERAIKELISIRRGEMPDRPLHQIGRVVADGRNAIAVARNRVLHGSERFSEFRGGWSALPNARQLFRVFEVTAATEQVPEAENRVVLSDARDALGIPRPVMSWRWGELERRSITRATSLFARELRRGGIGEVVPWTGLDGPARPVFGGIHHPMGTTRMHLDAERGVVDEDCRVHGMSNLYLAGSSVFPTGLGHANPTLTIVALALRLADHLNVRGG